MSEMEGEREKIRACERERDRQGKAERERLRISLQNELSFHNDTGGRSKANAISAIINLPRYEERMLVLFA